MNRDLFSFGPSSSLLTIIIISINYLKSYDYFKYFLDGTFTKFKPALLFFHDWRGE